MKKQSFVWIIFSLAWLFVSCNSNDREASESGTSDANDVTASDLFASAATNDVIALKALQKNGVDLHVIDETGQNALHIAAGDGANDALLYLNDQGLEIDSLDKQGNTPLLAAVRETQLETIKLLLRQNASPEVKNAKGYRPITLAAEKGDVGSVEALALYSRNHLDDALFVAALRGHDEMIDTLTNYGASVYVRLEQDNRTPLMLAAQNGHQEAVRVLLENGANRYSTDEQGVTASQLAKIAGHEEIAIYLGSTPKPEAFQFDEPSDALITEAVQEAIIIDRISSQSRSSQTQSEESDQLVTVPKLAEIKSLDGQKIALASEENASDTLQFKSYRESNLPIKISSVDDQKVAVKYLYGYHNVVEIAPGETIPHTNLTVVSAKKKRDHSKMTGGVPADISEVIVKDTTTGKKRKMTTGLNASRSKPFAVIKNKKTNQYLTAKKGDVFTNSAGKKVEVLEVRPKQLILLDLETGETQTVQK